MNEQIYKLALNELINQYERSKSLHGENLLTQRFKIAFFHRFSKATLGEKLFPKYYGGQDYEFKIELNDTFKELERMGFVFNQFQSEDLITSYLNIDKIEDIYAFIKRPKKLDVEAKEHQEILLQLEEAKSLPIAKAFLELLLKRNISHKSNKKFFEDIEELRVISSCIKAIEGNKEEIYLRKLSKKHLHNSKIMEHYGERLLSIFNAFVNSPFEEFDALLNHYHILKVPTPILLKGNMVISLNGQTIDIGALGEFALPPNVAAEIKTLSFSKVITIENQTTFFDYEDKDALLLYLGGYANSRRVEFLKMIKSQFPNLSFYHFGDIDWGGFEIFFHLRKQTGIDFIPLHMNEETLLKYKDECAALTENDRKHLTAVLEQDVLFFRDVIHKMLELNIKLEQESI